MKRALTIAALAAAAITPALAQTVITPATPQTRSLAELAKEEEARRKSVRKPAKVYSNDDLRPDPTRGSQPPSVASVSTSNASPANASPPAPSTEPAAPPRDQAYWSGRMKQLREGLQRSQIFLDSLQSRINALQTEYVNRDDPAQRARIEADRNTALAEFEKVKKEIAEQTKAIAALEEEARRAGVPPGWLRPGA